MEISGKIALNFYWGSMPRVIAEDGQRTVEISWQQSRFFFCSSLKEISGAVEQHNTVHRGIECWWLLRQRMLKITEAAKSFIISASWVITRRRQPKWRSKMVRWYLTLISSCYKHVSGKEEVAVTFPSSRHREDQHHYIRRFVSVVCR